jgi:hypothetical protein
MFRASLRPSSGVLKTVTATSGIGHNLGAAAVAVFSTPDDGRSDARNM